MSLSSRVWSRKELTEFREYSWTQIYQGEEWNCRSWDVFSQKAHRWGIEAPFNERTYIKRREYSLWQIPEQFRTQLNKSPRRRMLLHE